MKLRNKKTGEVDDFKIVDEEDGSVLFYDHIAELNEEWGDCEEPKEVWYIDFQGGVRSAAKEENDWFKENEIGNCFYSKEEAEKAVEKLKAWKRLKQGGFHWNSWTLGGAHFGVDLYDGYNNDLDLVFGGEE